MTRLWVAALLCIAATPSPDAPRLPAEDREVLERMPLRPREPAGAQLRALRAAAWMAERIFDLKLL